MVCAPAASAEMLYPVNVQVSGLDDPVQLAITALPASTLKVSPPDGAAPLPAYAMLAEKLAVAVP